MRIQLNSKAIVMAIAVSVAGTASAYTVFERNDYETHDDDPTNDYGDMSGTCSNGTRFTVNYQSDYRGRVYFTDLENQSSDEAIVIGRYCGEQ